MPSKEKKKDKRSKLMRKLGRSRSENVVSQSQRAPGMVGLLEAMRVQMEVLCFSSTYRRHNHSIFILPCSFKHFAGFTSSGGVIRF